MGKPPDTYPEDIRETFEHCPECGRVVVSLGQHRCPPDDDGGGVTSADREALAAADDRPAGEDVLYPKGRSTHSAWAYHELDDEGDPLHSPDYKEGHDIGPREEAIEKGCYPCGTCRNLIETREDGEADG